MVNVDEFLSKCKQPVKQRDYRPLTSAELETKKNIIEYLLKHKEIVNYTERVYNKLECVLNDLIGGK